MDMDTDAAAAALTAVSRPIVKQEPGVPPPPPPARRPTPYDVACLRARIGELEKELTRTHMRALRLEERSTQPCGTGSFAWKGEFVGDWIGVLHSVERRGQLVYQQRPHGEGRHHNRGVTRDGTWRDGRFVRGTIRHADGTSAAFPLPDTRLLQADRGQASLVLDPRLLKRLSRMLPQTVRVTVVAVDASDSRYFRCRVDTDAAVGFGPDDAEMKNPWFGYTFVGMRFTLEIDRPSTCSNAVYFRWPFRGSRDVDGRGDEGGNWRLRCTNLDGGWRVVTCRHHRAFAAAVSPDRGVVVTFDGFETNVAAEMSPGAMINCQDVPALYVNLASP